MILRLPCTVVFDHIGRMAPVTEAYTAARRVVHTQLQRGTGWVKLSGHYLAGGIDSAAPIVAELLTVAMTATAAMILVVNPGVKAQNLGEFLQLAKQNPGKIS